MQDQGASNVVPEGGLCLGCRQLTPCICILIWQREKETGVGEKKQELLLFIWTLIPSLEAHSYDLI